MLGLAWWPREVRADERVQEAGVVTALAVIGACGRTSLEFLLHYPPWLHESPGHTSITAQQKEEVVMGQKWTTAHKLACRDENGALTRVYHQVLLDEAREAVQERFVLGNSEPVSRARGLYHRENGKIITPPPVSLP